MACDGVSPAEIAPPPAAGREARDADPAVGREPSSMASPVGSEVRAPPEAEARAAPRTDHEREPVDEEHGRMEADWDEVLRRLARVDHDLDAFAARRDGGESRFATTSATTSATGADDAAGAGDANDATPTETMRVAGGGFPPAVPDDARVTERERQTDMDPAASRGSVARLAASMMSSLEGPASAAEEGAARAEAVAAVEAFYDALLERREKRARCGPASRANAPPPQPPLPPPRCKTFAESSRPRDDVANLRRMLETL